MKSGMITAAMMAAIATAPTVAGVPLGPCLLALGAGEWTVGRFDGEDWFDEAGGVVAPRFYAALPTI